jgi:hypothetical protein
LICDRQEQRRAFLDAAGLATARREPLAGDASTRRYERLHRPNGASLILMDQPPSLEAEPCPPAATPGERAALGYNALARLAAGRVEAFVACAGYLNGLGLSAPRVVFADPPAGFAVLEDLGDDLFARLMAAGADEAPLYEGAIAVLARLHAETPTDFLSGYGARWPLLAYDDLALKTGADLLPQWLPRFTGAPAPSAEAMVEWDACGPRCSCAATPAPASFAFATTTLKTCCGCRFGKGLRGWGCWISRTPCAPIRRGICRCSCTTPVGK